MWFYFYFYFESSPYLELGQLSQCLNDAVCLLLGLHASFPLPIHSPGFLEPGSYFVARPASPLWMRWPVWCLLLHPLVSLLSALPLHPSLAPGMKRPGGGARTLPEEELIWARDCLMHLEVFDQSSLSPDELGHPAGHIPCPEPCSAAPATDSVPAGLCHGPYECLGAGSPRQPRSLPVR